MRVRPSWFFSKKSFKLIHGSESSCHADTCRRHIRKWLWKRQFSKDYFSSAVATYLRSGSRNRKNGPVHTFRVFYIGKKTIITFGHPDSIWAMFVIQSDGKGNKKFFSLPWQKIWLPYARGHAENSNPVYSIFLWISILHCDVFPYCLFCW